MKTLAIVLPSVVLAFVVGFIVTSEGLPSAMFIAPTEDVHNLGMIGHVEYVQRNAVGDIIHYMQSDNLVMENGKDCAAAQTFDTNNAIVAAECPSFSEYRYIGIGNATCVSCEDATRNQLQAEMENRREDTAVAGFTLATGGLGTIVVINTEAPFTFNTANASDNVFESGLFDTLAPGTGNVFAIQNVTATSPNPGIDVNNGDTLDVTWTITVG